MDWALAEQFKAPESGWAELAGVKLPTEEPWRDRAWGRAGRNLAAITGRWRVDEEQGAIERAAAEVVNTSLYVTCAAMRPPHEFRVDFFIMHVANASFWLQGFLQRDSLSCAQKARLVEDTGRLLTFLAAGVGMPALHPEVLERHVMKSKGGQGLDWDGVFDKVCRHADDGHMIKFIRALASGEKMSLPFEGQPGFPMRQDMFLRAANAALDNTSSKPMAFLRHFDLLRGVGLPQAWEDVPHQVQVADGRNGLNGPAES